MRALLPWIVLGCVGCSGVDDERRSLATPDATRFPLVAEAIAPSCATLDCHGQTTRNFRFYWSRGLRLAADARPGEGETTAEEYASTHRSLVALEPYKVDAVVRGAARADTLTLVRKGRGAEAHAGGARLVPGSDADRCLVSWLGGAIDEEACRRATP